MRLILGAVAALVLALSLPARVSAQTKVTFGTDWLAEAEHGGFYEALALGLYRKHGLDVTIRMGGPANNPIQQVAAGVVDLQLTSGSFDAVNAVEQDVPVVAVAAYFQKDPQVLISHPGQGNDTLEAMRGKPIMISAAARNGYWLFLKAKFGFTDEQIRPYTFNMAPFLADPHAIQQGFVSSEPYQIERAGGVKPVVNLLADSGYAGYSALVLTRADTVRDRPQVVRAFIEASTEGWYRYLYGDPKPAHDLILAANNEMTQPVLDNARTVMTSYGIADSGDSLTLGLGAMTDARWRAFFDDCVKAGLYKPDTDVRKAYTLQFVDAGYGMELRRP
ncbi:MAG: ABC transporter substrate-binding protein [Acidisphaera sp.]|nr:ABC transporter substrate-binding protein [Acidisphaera sp.]MBV9813182.1 ABC transporter substrate-binding protein [Acetobacteraceae bacterium]